MSYACDAAIMSRNLVPFCLTPTTVRAPVHFSLECIRIQICLGTDCSVYVWFIFAYILAVFAIVYYLYMCMYVYLLFT